MSEAASPLIPSVYHAVPEPARWTGVVADLARELRAPTATLILGFRGDERGARRFSVGVGPSMRPHFESFLARDRALFAPVFDASPRSFTILSEGGSRSPFTRSNVYREWMRPRRLRHLVAGRLHGASDHLCGLGVMRGENDPPFGPRELDLLADVAPHLERALEVQEAADAVENALLRIAETLRVGVLVVEGGGRVLFANHKARSILAERDGLVHERSELRAVLPRENARLHRALAEAAVGGRRDDGAALFLSRPSGRAPLHVLVNALRKSASLPAIPSRAALLFLVDAEEGCPIAENALRRRYGLTRAEARVAACIARGERPAGIAQALCVRISTVRTHLQHVLDKTGTHRQSELVRCLLTGENGFEA